jgi:hypothetical protein
MQYLTPRGWFVFGVVSALVVWGLVLVSACLWWVGIDSPKAEFLGGVGDQWQSVWNFRGELPPTASGGGWWSAAKCGRGRERERSP